MDNYLMKAFDIVDKLNANNSYSYYLTKNGEEFLIERRNKFTGNMYRIGKTNSTFLLVKLLRTFDTEKKKRYK